ncbi:MAG: nicotinate-nucleotide--dimethylbenzimidazole phosphoribosyltransferase [Alphaproteobacteria bacterium]|nr:nicotinate-nucleotide--dimethylbenzimidazole phosphoribosyltransferase [Alphaproteobacteria bacterium]
MDIEAPPAAILDRFRADAADLPTPDRDAEAAARGRQTHLTKPPGSLGRLEDIAVHMAAWQGRAIPRMDKGAVLIFAGSHGIAADGVSAYPPEVTAQMVANFEAGGAAINQLSACADLSLSVHPLDVDRPTRSFRREPAMTKTELAEALEIGRRAVAPDLDLLIPGEMGIANTTSAAALCAAVFGGTGADWAGPGTGLTGDRLDHKAAVIDMALALHRESLDDPVESLRRLGGRELAAIAGALLAARRHRIPVVLDGFGATAAAAILWKLNGAALENCLAGHVSAEPAHRKALAAMGLSPLLDLGMRLGEGSGAATAALLVRAALSVHQGMATFAEAGVSES